MNLAGKVIIVLIFLMSLVFMTFALSIFSTHRNWREEIKGPGGLQEQLTKAREENARVVEDQKHVQETLDTELEAKTQALAKLEAELTAINEQLLALQKQFEQKGKDLVATADQLKSEQQSLINLRKEIDTLRAEIHTVQGNTNEQFKKALVLADKLHVALGQCALLDERNQQLNQDVSTNRENLKQP